MSVDAKASQKLTRLLVTGANGQLGKALLGLRPDCLALARDELDLSDIDGLETAFRQQLDKAGNISGVINAAAYTAVDKAETDRDIAKSVNALAPGIMAAICAERDIPFVHVSTDYVFDGEASEPYKPSTPTDPINVYGSTKRDGEIAVIDQGGRYAVLRTSWVYNGTSGNFLTTMLRLAETRDALSVVHDQIGRPTYATDLAQACLAAIDGLTQDPSLSDIYHVSNSGKVISWAQFAEEIFKRTGKTVNVSRIPASEYPTPAKRPAYSVMDLFDFEAAFRFELPTWTDGLERALAER